MKFNLIESINKQEIIKAVKEKFDAQNYPVEGPTYILPDGSFLDIAGTFDPKNSFEDFPCHAEVEGFLLDIGLSNQVVDVSGSPTLESLGAIRCNDLADNNFIQLSNIRPTSDQYESLENWIYENATHRSELIVATPEFIQYKKYDPEDVEYIIKRIKRYYTSGNLYENMIENKSLEEAKKKKRKKKKQKALGWWQTFTPDAGNVLMNNAFFNHTMGNTTTDEFVADMDAAMGEFGGDVGSCGMGESFSKDEHFYRVEVFNDNIYVGGLFRGLNDLINDLYDADDPLYDYINNPLSELEYKTYYPKDFLYTDAIFAYKENKYKELEETILDLKAELNSIGWDLDIKIINRPENIVYEDDQQIAYISSVKENTNIIKNKNGALNEEMENQELRYTVKRYGEWWWGIIDHTLNNGSGLMMRAGVNPDYNAPLDKGENKLLLFKSKELAQEHCDKLNKETLSENISIFERGDFNKYKISDEELEEVKNRSIIKEEFISGRYVWCNYSDVQGMNIYQLCRFIEDKYKEKYHESIKVNDIEDQSYDYSNKELPYIVRVEKIKEEDYDFWFVIHCTEEEAKDLLYDPTNECVKPEVEESVNNTQICSICGKEYEGYGNNAEPINDGRCCDECNLSKVIPARLGLMKESLEQVERFIDSDTSLTSSSGEVEFANGDVRGVDTIYLYKDGNQCYLKGYGHSFKNTYAWTPLTYVEIDQFDESDSQFFDTNKYDIINLTGLVNKYKEYFQTEDIFINECLTDVNEAFDLLNKLED